ncbi:MAG: type II toxin-antitoxin system HicB family antitoxin [Terriglobales bacterium]
MANHASKKRAAKVRAGGSDRLKPRVFRVVFDREEDGRWIAEVPELAGVMVYGESKQEALLRVQALAYRVIAAV